jgi:hypothetical protein
MDIVCSDCGAMIWDSEKVKKDLGTDAVKVSMCCKKGKITLPYIKEPPLLLRNLFNGIHPKSSNFLTNIRSYNNMFSFTSLGGKIDTGKNKGKGPPHFVIAGQNYHRLGSLIPNDGEPPKFAQLYIYDTQNEVANRLSHFRFNFIQLIYLTYIFTCFSFYVYNLTYLIFLFRCIFYILLVDLK